MAREKPIILADNRLEDGTLSATATAAGTAVANLKDWRSFTGWTGVGTGDHYVTVNIATAKTADCIGIFGHNFGTAGATISVEGSTDNFTGDTTVALAGFAPSDDFAILRKFDSLNKDDWRLKMTGMSVAPSMAILVIGNKLEMERWLQKGWQPTPEQVEGNATRGRKGHHLGSVVEIIMLDFRPRWKLLTESWVENSFKPLWDSHLSLLKPFFWADDPGDHVDRVYLAAMEDRAKFDSAYDPVRRSLNLRFSAVKEL